MKIKLLVPYLNHEAGSIVEYGIGVAEALIASHRAVKYEEPQTKMVKESTIRNKAVAIK